MKTMSFGWLFSPLMQHMKFWVNVLLRRLNWLFQVCKVDILKEEDLVPHIKGSDAVVSCIGGRASLFGWTPCSLYTDSMKSIVGAMRKSGVNRLIAMSAWGTKGKGSKEVFFTSRHCIRLTSMYYY